MRLIDANKLKQDVLDWQDCYNGFSDTYDKAMIIGEIDEQPTIEAEPVRYGKWIEDDIDKWRCSVCQKGDVYAFSWSISEGYELQDNYCPHCGAKMIPTIPKEIIDEVLGEDEV